MAEISSQGYDDPISLRKEDHLERWSFAREVFSIADTAPAQWSVRIGVYGGWGTGKTSVLKFIETMAREKEHIVVRFNPWPYQTIDEMWEGFIDEVRQSFEDAALNVKNSRVEKTRSVASKLAKVVSKADELDGLAKLFNAEAYVKLARKGVGKLAGFLKANAQQLQKMVADLGERRIIVFIDDLDRTDLHLLPEVLYALREVLDLPSFVFILGFDPLVIGEALKKHHPGWGDGKRFLEKIIDFPRPLPPPTKKQLLNLVKSDVISHGSFIELDALERIFKFLPENPRQLRSFIRSLWGIKPQVIRYNPNELSWSKILLAHLLKFKQPDLAHACLQDSQLLKDWAWEKKMSEGKSNSDKMNTIYRRFEELCKQVELNNQQEKQDCLSIIDEMVGGSFWCWDEIEISTLTRLSEEPSILTFKEVEDILAVWMKVQRVCQIQRWIFDHVKRIELTYEQVSIALFEKLVNYWDIQLRQAENVIRDERRNYHIEQARNAVTLLEKLSFDLGGFVGEDPYLSVHHFSSILDKTQKRMKLDIIPDYRSPIDSMSNFLKEILSKATLDPLLLFEVLEPWNPYRGNIPHQDRMSSFFKPLDSIIEHKAAEKVVEYLKVENVFNKRSKILIYLVLRQNSSLWRSSDLKQIILQMAATADTSSTVQDNLLKLFQLFADELERNQDIGTVEHKAFCLELLHEPNVIEELWKGALATAINPLEIRKYKKSRKIIMEYIDVQLTVPNSWDQ